MSGCADCVQNNLRLLPTTGFSNELVNRFQTLVLAALLGIVKGVDQRYFSIGISHFFIILLGP